MYCFISTNYYSVSDSCDKYSGGVIYEYNYLGNIVGAKIARSNNDILPLLCESWNNNRITLPKTPIAYTTINFCLRTSNNYHYDPQERLDDEDDDDYDEEDYDFGIPERNHDYCTSFNGGIIKGTKYNISTQTCHIIMTHVVNSNAEILPTLCKLWNPTEIDNLIVTLNPK